MTTQTIVCTACSADVPYGRLSCPACGELLASVAGARRAGGKTSRAAKPRTTAPAVAEDLGPAAGEDPAPAAAKDLQATRDLEAELPWAAADAHGPGWAADDEGAADHDVDDRIDADDPDDDLADDDDGADLNGLARGTSTTHGESGPATWAVGGGLTGSVTPRYMPRPVPRSSEAPDVTGATMAPASADHVPFVAPPPAPGAWVPPLPAIAPAGPPAPARTWIGQTAPPAAYVDQAPGASNALVGPSAAPVAAGRPSVDVARISEFAGWLSVAGAAFAAVGFLLPWARVVIGANGLSYVDRWGLAGQNHVLVVLGVLTLLVLGLVGNPVPVWVRAGIGGLGLGPLLLGLVWPYLFVGALGSGPGIPIVAVGAVALIVSGVLAIVADRHGTAAPGV